MEAMPMYAETVLVVDDERVIREGCRRLLTGEGFQVHTAEDGMVALNILASHKVDVILCDLKMPGMSAIEVLEKVSEDYPDLPFIVITGHGTISNAVECMKKGAYEFVTKPFQPDHLILIIRRALEKLALKRRTKELQEAQAKNLYDLAAEQSRIRTITNCMADGVLVTNRDLEVVLHNHALMRLMELSSCESTPGRLLEFFPDEGFAGELERLLSAPPREAGFASREVTKGGTSMRALSAPMYGPDQEALGTVTVFQDITNFKQLDEMKSNFVHMVSHELRSPMAAIKQQLAVILDGLAGEVTDKQRELLSRAQDKIQSLIDLVSDLLDVAKIESGHGIQQQVPVDLGKVLEEVVALLNSKAEHQSVRLHLELPSQMPAILADRRSMDEVFTNLVSNAVNYSPNGGDVRVSARSHEDYVEVLVSDTGVGIAPEELPKIFDKFYRVKHPSTRKVIGTGLGLAIVKGIVDSHRGSIRVESQPGVGTTFRILLPVAAA